jgi:hypothetical protein
MNAVDTGWVTDEDPAELAKKKQELEDFQPFRYCGWCSTCNGPFV